MQTRRQFYPELMCLLLAAAFATNARLRADDSLSPAEWRLLERAITSAYQKAALGVLVAEVNHAVAVLQLPENLPLRESNLTEEIISPPLVNERLGGWDA